MNYQKGYSLFELVITLTISSILIVLAGGILNIGVKSYHHLITRSIMYREAQNTFQFMQNEIAMAIPEYIVQAQNKRFRFITSESKEIDIRYQLGQGNLCYRILGEHDWRVLLNNIKNNSFSFTYFKGDSTTWSSVDEIKRVSISFDLNLAGEETSYENHYYIRN